MFTFKIITVKSVKAKQVKRIILTKLRGKITPGDKINDSQ